ncbi:hypothetical protein [Terasakiella sp.]|uniref:hypothetical protein n=1 Tax=Terasakiella sp. TaxID=2034861 RepID=UPI003AA94E6A
MPLFDNSYAPRGEKWGKEPFEDWYKRIHDQYPQIPKCIMKQWLYENWGSPLYDFIELSDYTFTQVTWNTGELLNVYSDMCKTLERCIGHGDVLCNGPQFESGGNPLPGYMLAEKKFPVPIIINDNFDGHLHQYDEYLPPRYILMEGHCRFNIAMYLHHEGQFSPTVEIWLMKRRDR